MTHYQRTHNEQKKPTEQPTRTAIKISDLHQRGGTCEEALKEGLGEGGGGGNRRQPTRNGAAQAASNGSNCNCNRSSWVPLRWLLFQWHARWSAPLDASKKGVPSRLKIWSDFPTAACSSSAHVRPINSPVTNFTHASLTTKMKGSWDLAGRLVCIR